MNVHKQTSNEAQAIRFLYSFTVKAVGVTVCSAVRLLHMYRMDGLSVCIYATFLPSVERCLHKQNLAFINCVCIKNNVMIDSRYPNAYSQVSFLHRYSVVNKSRLEIFRSVTAVISVALCTSDGLWR